MKYDIFFSICQTPVGGYTPDEPTMFRNFVDQVQAADALGYDVGWIAESHLSSQVQKRHREPVIPHWQGEVGLNVDFLQLASHVFARTKRIELGSAIMNILCNGGPVAAAERVAAFLSFHGLDPAERRRIHVGFAAGRFDFMNRAYGVGPRTAWERAAWGPLKTALFRQSGEIFVRLLRGDELAASELEPLVLSRPQFRTDAEWDRVRELAGTTADTLEVPPYYQFEVLKIVPSHFRRELLQLVAGSHDGPTQEHLNQFLPVQVFNLSITSAAVIDDTHRRMSLAYHAAGGPWRRDYMPRTVFVFLNAQEGRSAEQRRAAAQEEATAALGAYWSALDGTVDPKKVAGAADNAIIGDPAAVAQQIRERFHPDDRLMLWFDFFNHDNARVIENMAAFREQVLPLLERA